MVTAYTRGRNSSVLLVHLKNKKIIVLGDKSVNDLVKSLIEKMFH
jgi:hypothetical protein